jgi:hypothetical protein
MEKVKQKRKFLWSFRFFLLLNIVFEACFLLYIVMSSNTHLNTAVEQEGQIRELFGEGQRGLDASFELIYGLKTRRNCSALPDVGYHYQGVCFIAIQTHFYLFEENLLIGLTSKDGKTDFDVLNGWGDL